MTPPEPQRDLVLVVADKDMEFALRGILARPEALGTRAVSHDFRRLGDHDAGVRLEAHDYLRDFSTDWRYALVLFDHDGCGDTRPVAEVEQSVQARLDGSGWAGRSAVMVIEPELEAWVWSASPRVHEGLGISADQRRELLAERALTDVGKPADPKEALHAALRLSRTRASASLFRDLASSVSLRRCQDRSFQRLVSVLRSWFPPDASSSTA